MQPKIQMSQPCPSYAAAITLQYQIWRGSTSRPNSEAARDLSTDTFPFHHDHGGHNLGERGYLVDTRRQLYHNIITNETSFTSPILIHSGGLISEVQRSITSCITPQLENHLYKSSSRCQARAWEHEYSNHQKVDSLPWDDIYTQWPPSSTAHTAWCTKTTFQMCHPCRSCERSWREERMRANARP